MAQTQFHLRASGSPSSASVLFTGTLQSCIEHTRGKRAYLDAWTIPTGSATPRLAHRIYSDGSYSYERVT